MSDFIIKTMEELYEKMQNNQSPSCIQVYIFDCMKKCYEEGYNEGINKHQDKFKAFKEEFEII